MAASRQIFLGQQLVNEKKHNIEESFRYIEGEQFYEIKNYRQIPPFFMTITSNTNHWMFISSTGGLTAGRINSESAIFPYYTDDRITENDVNTGPKTILLIEKNNKTFIWEPFSDNKNLVYDIHSSISKNLMGNAIIFEETNETLGVSFSYKWMNSRKFGWIRKSAINNLGNDIINIEILDGLQNILPAGTSSQIQNTFGNLLNAYKKSEIDTKTGMGIFALSATLTDLAEPSESLKANTLWHTGLDVNNYLLSSEQLESFSKGRKLRNESENKGNRGCYFINSSISLSQMESKHWYFAADVDKDHSQINDLNNLLFSESNNLEALMIEDIKKGNDELTGILFQNDGLQNTSGKMNCVHHQANVLFNIMRGGYFYKSYTISTKDFLEFIHKSNTTVAHLYEFKIQKLNEQLTYDEVLSFVLNENNSDLERIWYEYLPLTFSRRHGDPSRPWNVFSIETEMADGEAKLDYQGNWRDIFQNWEALCYSYPKYTKHIIGKFLNATTKDGYNPYRITKDGIDWEIPEPGNPWANIGYWSDHQIIYLVKLLEMYHQFNGDQLNDELDRQVYSFANVPYEIKSFDEIVHDPYQTINFNYDKNEKIEELSKKLGSQGKLLHDGDGRIFLATLTEKLFILLLAKLGNYIPEGGIWMNTQRPEWNDANNALVGKGISLVTLAYLRRYISFLLNLYKDSPQKSYMFYSDTAQWFNSISSVFSTYEKELNESHSPDEIYAIVESLGVASENYRNKLYQGDLVKNQTKITRNHVIQFLESVLNCVDDTLRKNKRDDDLYHSYNTLQIKNKEMIIHNLYEMLEGQVAVLSSGLLSVEEADRAFRALRNSSMYRADQDSYMLYPNRELPAFLDKNNIDKDRVESFKLLKKLIESDNTDLINRDETGLFHFNGNFRNVKQVSNVLEKLSVDESYGELVREEGSSIEELFESTFNHQSFTGRSGTFFAFEGLGSIYWHMVSKLLLAAQENLFKAIEDRKDEKIILAMKEHYYAIRKGIGYNKSAEVYGAFPFDPYSHTPYGKGAKQPGMTGQVKEEVITRFAEMGIRIVKGRINFDGTLIDEKEFHTKDTHWDIETTLGDNLTLELLARSFGATFCQTPYLIRKGLNPEITVHFKDERKQIISGTELTADLSEEIFNRTGKIAYLSVVLK